MLLVLLSCVLAAGSLGPQAKAVGVRYADGVVSYTRLQQGGGFWKPSIPTVAGARTERDGARIRISQLRWAGGPVPVSAPARSAIQAPALSLGRTYASLEKVLPPPVRRFTVSPFQNPHAEVLGARWTVDYGGIEVTFFSSPSSTSILVTAVTVTDLKWLTLLGVDIDSSRFEIERQLGSPLTFDNSTMRYEDEEGSDIGPSALTVYFDGDRLVRASWTFPWD